MQKLTRPLSNNLLFSFLGILFFLSSTKNLLAQCPTGSTEVTVTYTTGAFDNENSWVLWDATNNMSLACYEESQVGTNIQTACVPNGAQIELITYESFGDGWHESTISVEVSEDGTDGSSCSNIASTSIFSNLAPINGEGSPNNPGSIPQGEIDVCPPASVPTDIACQNTFSIDNTCAITGSSTTSIVGPTGPLCVEEQFTFTGGTTGSTWSGSFITDNRDGTATFTAFFPGTYTVLLTNGTGCSVASVVTVEGINPFTDGQSQLCPSSDAVLLGPANPNTSWSGTGVTNNGDGTATFDPSIAGLGLHTATFTYSNATTGCIYTREFDFSVNNSTPPDPGSYGPVCISGGPITLVGNPPDVNGFWFGPEVTDNQDGTATFDPSAFGGNTTVTINYGINGGCISETEIEIIGGDPFVPNYNPFCETDGDFTLFADPAGGVWSGLGVIDNSDGTYNFSPSTVGVGIYPLTYTYQEPTNMCAQNVVTTEITVMENTVDPGTYGPVCSNEGPIMLSGTPLTSNSAWFGPGITDNGDGTAIFDPSVFGGNSTATVTYRVFGNCDSQTDIEVIDATPFVPNYAPTCENFFDFRLFANPSGGVWTGLGVIDNEDGTYNFSASTAGLGTHTLSYTYQEPTNFCGPSIVTTDIIVIENTLDPGTYGPLCGTDAPITLMGNPLDPSGFWFGPGVTNTGDGTATFDPSLFNGEIASVTYGVGGCRQSTEIMIEGARPFLDVFPNIREFCLGQDPVQLFFFPDGGTWLGDGLIFEDNGSVFFDPTVAGVGVTSISYTTTDDSGCPPATQTIEFTVSDGIPPDPGTYDPVCYGDDPVLLVGTPNDGTGSWSGFGGPVIETNADGTGTFYPDRLPTGLNGPIDIIYTHGGCSSATTITVNGSPVFTFVDIPFDQQLCSDNPPINLFAGPFGGIWTGPGVIPPVTNSDANALFDPALAGPGTFTLTYTHEYEGTGCTPQSNSTIVTVTQCIVDLEVSDPCSCSNPANIEQSDGSILFQDVLTATTSTGLTVVLDSNDGNLLDNTGTPIPVGTPLVESSSGVYTLDFYTRENQPATVTVSNGLRTIIFVTDSCSCPVEAEVQNIPTMTQWGLIIFGLLILNLSLIFIREQDRFSPLNH